MRARARLLDLALHLLELLGVREAVLHEQRAHVLDGVARAPHALDLVARAVRGPRVADAVPVVPVRVLARRAPQRDAQKRC